MYDLKKCDYVNQHLCFFPIHSCVPYVPDPENTLLLKCAVDLYRKFKQYPQAMRFAMGLNDMDLIKDIFTNCPDEYVDVTDLNKIIHSD